MLLAVLASAPKEVVQAKNSLGINIMGMLGMWTGDYLPTTTPDPKTEAATQREVIFNCIVDKLSIYDLLPLIATKTTFSESNLQTGVGSRLRGGTQFTLNTFETPNSLFNLVVKKAEEESIDFKANCATTYTPALQRLIQSLLTINTEYNLQTAIQKLKQNYQPGIVCDVLKALQEHYQHNIQFASIVTTAISTSAERAAPRP